MREKARQREATWLESKQKAQQMVLIYAWFLISTSSSAISPNIQTNLAGECAYVKQRMIKYELFEATTPSIHKNTHKLSPDALELVNIPLGTAAMQVVKRNISAARPERESMEMYESDSGIEFTDPFPFRNPPPFSGSTSTMLSSTSSVSAISTSFASTTSTSSALSTPDWILPFLAIVGSKKLCWPQDFFTIDIIDCLEEIEETAGEANACSVFECHFGNWVPYKPSTFYEHLQC
ncbi:hypothetical protein BYT27DRAFT_7249072 [Phlegmacium glaucopus]|nr:hypothetical protein BYT27DRAFT_7249072 [Phlegmacium glaucopus]